MAYTAADGPAIDERIVKFIEAASVLNFATSVKDAPYCASVYFAYEPTHHWFIFKSDPDTKHIEQALQNTAVAGTILPDKIDKLVVKGIQFTGTFMQPDSGTLDLAKSVYLKKYPIATIFRGDIWIVEVHKIKYTDNTPIVGKKILWER